MKKLLLVIAIVVLAGCGGAEQAEAWTISWTGVSGADGYAVFYKPLINSGYTEVDTSTATNANLDALGLAEGTRYEFFVRAYAGTPKSYSGDSDHIRWTYPSPPIVVEMLGQPVNIVINP